MNYKSVNGFGESRFTEKRSIFIGRAQHVQSKEAAEAFIHRIRSEEPAATHHCYAYCLEPGARIQKADDHGEPQGTAGRPMLEVLLREEVSNVCVVVTRYFGGILLGAPGLIRAYTRGCTEALHAAGLVMFRPFVEVEASFSYAAQGRVDYALSGQTVLKRNYGANVTLNLLLAEADVDKVHEVLLNLTSGMLTWKIIQECMEPTDASGKPIKRK